MKKQFKFVMAQLDFLVGDIEGNARKIICYTHLAKEMDPDLVIFPELALTGYPPEDLLFREGLYERIHSALNAIAQASFDIDILVGYPIKKEGTVYNGASLLSKGNVVTTYYKTCLPNYSVFDEVRYFKPGDSPLVLNYKGLPLGIMICEDLWHDQPLKLSVAAGAKLVISINASPFDVNKHEARVSLLQKKASNHHIPIIYVNCVGGQDELVFDGGSLVLNEKGTICQKGPFYQEKLIPIEFSYYPEQGKIDIVQSEIPPKLSKEELIYGALVLGVRDYIEKNHFPGAILGLSGGIDSALTLAIAVDAIGADRIEAVLMPSRYTSQISIDDAKEEAELLGVSTSFISIEQVFDAFLKTLKDEFASYPPNITEENLQARCRGTLLMAISNKKGSIVLATGNKSEISVGYCTLYGDMVGGFSVLKDIPKTLVYRLAYYRNQISKVIPDRVIAREPSAELTFNQKDQDSLPPYSTLDKILELYIEKDKSYKQIVDLGFDPEIVKQVVLMVDKSEYKRRQGAPGVRISLRAFGKDRRYPITSGYSNYLRFTKK
jgi:NAD+ synthase (glutamine-hydrolysing)